MKAKLCKVKNALYYIVYFNVTTFLCRCEYKLNTPTHICKRYLVFELVSITKQNVDGGISKIARRNLTDSNIELSELYG